MNNPFVQSVRFRPWGAILTRVSSACLRGAAFVIAMTGLCLAPASQAQNVNWIQEVGAATGNTPAIYARGSDANVGLNLIPKGNGAVNVSGSFTVNGAPLAGGGVSDRLVSGSALLRLSDLSLDLTYPGAATFNVTGGATEFAALQIGAGRTGNGFAYIDLVGDPTYSDYGLRLIRNTGGANTDSSLRHRGTGLLYFVTEDSAPMYFYTSNTFAMGIGANGRVGIGTYGPDAKLEISGGANSWTDGILLRQTGAGGRAYSLASRGGGMFIIGDETAGESRFIMSPSGDVGIGTTSPAAKLHVGAGARFNNVIVGTNGSGGGMDMAYPYESVGVTTGNLRLQSPLGIGFHTGMTSSEPDDTSKMRMFIDSSGNVGIRTLSPQTKLHVYGGIRAVGGRYYDGLSAGYTFAGNGGDDDSGMFSLSDGNLSFYTNDVPRVTIDPYGRVGIGTEAPTEKLVVLGSIRVLGTDYMVYNSNRCKSDGDAGTDPLGYCEGNGRALVHDAGDLLVINYAGDFDGGVAVRSNLQVDGNVTAAAYYQSSDLRLKTDVAAIDDPFALLAGVEGRHFRWKASGKAAYGVIAQDVARVMPEAVGRGTSGTLTVDYAQMVAPLVEAVKQLDQRVKALEAENLRLQAASRSH